MPGPAINNGTSKPSERATTRHRAAAALSVLRLPEALWVGIVLAILAGVWAWYGEGQESRQRAAVQEARAEADRAAWRARAEQLSLDLQAVQSGLREEIARARQERTDSLARVRAIVEKNGLRLERCLSLLDQRGPEIRALQGLPDRLREVEARIRVIEDRLSRAKPGQGIPPK